MGTIRLVNTTRDMPITVRAFDGEETTINASGEAIPVDEKFDWNLPRGIKNLDRKRPVKAERSSQENTEVKSDTPVDAAAVDEKELNVNETPADKTVAVEDAAPLKETTYSTGTSAKKPVSTSANTSKA